MAIRLQKFLAESGIASRRQAELFIARGRARINGELAKVGDKVDPDRDSVTLDGRPVAPRKKLYILLHKPYGVITTVEDTHGRKTVVDCLKGFPQRVFPVGRLDADVTGALLLTNDGELAFRLTHPKYMVDKVYEAWVGGSVKPRTVEKMRTGIQLEDGRARAVVEILEEARQATRIRLTVREGRKHLVKRLCKGAGHTVRELRRVSVAGVETGDLAPGAWRFLEGHEVAKLRRIARL